MNLNMKEADSIWNEMITQIYVQKMKNESNSNFMNLKTDESYFQRKNLNYLKDDKILMQRLKL